MLPENYEFQGPTFKKGKREGKREGMAANRRTRDWPEPAWLVHSSDGGNVRNGSRRSMEVPHECALDHRSGREGR